MRIHQIIPVRESRTNKEKNKKLSRDEQLTDIARVYGTDNIYVSFTEVNKLGVNVRSKYHTPTGIYSYPIEYVIDKGAKNVPFAKKSPYVQVFRNNTPLENTWIISDKLNPDIANRLSTVLEKETGKPSPAFKNNKSLWKYMFEFIMGKDFKKSLDWTNDDNYFADPKERKPSEYAPRARRILISAEIYAVIDNGTGIIYPDEPTQALFLKTEYLEHIDTIVGGQETKKEIDPSKIKNPADLAAAYKNLSAEEAFNKMIEKTGKKARAPEFEPAIMKNPHLAYVYALDVIKGRWPEAEKYIIKDPAAARNYAAFVLNQRWPAAEPVIFSDNKYKKLYKSDFGIK